MFRVRQSRHLPTREHGAVLFLAMIFLVMLAVLAITASSSSIMQERMTGGLRNRQLGLMGVETTLRGGEEFLWALSFNNNQPLPPCLDDDTTGDCVYKPLPNGQLRAKVQAFRTATTWLDPATDGARSYDRSLTGLSGDAVTASLASQPRYIIEYLGVNAPPSSGQTGGAIYRGGSGAMVGSHHFFRVTARSQGGSDAVIRVAESVYSALDLSNSDFNP